MIKVIVIPKLFSFWNVMQSIDEYKHILVQWQSEVWIEHWPEDSDFVWIQDQAYGNVIYSKYNVQKKTLESKINFPFKTLLDVSNIYQIGTPVMVYEYWRKFMKKSIYTKKNLFAIEI